MRIKICGITQVADALLAEQLGAYAIGMNFFPGSPRYIHPAKASKLVRSLHKTLKIGIFVNQSIDFIRSAFIQAQLDFVQLHGDETSNFCDSLNLPFIKVIRPQRREDLDQLDNYPSANAILVDAHSHTKYGGTGLTASWELAKHVSTRTNLYLAGGITPDNIVMAHNTVHPFAIDVCSGVERAHGIKDHQLMRQLFMATEKLNNRGDQDANAL